jgi:hypothetical protein
MAMWRKAIDTAGDASLADLTDDGAIRLAYDAGHSAALTLLAAHGLRTGGGHGHHEMASYGAAAFGDSGLEELVPESEDVRRLRHGSVYDTAIASPADRASSKARTTRR